MAVWYGCDAVTAWQKSATCHKSYSSQALHLGEKSVSQNVIILGVSMKKKLCDYCGIFYPEDSFGVAVTTPTKVYRRRKCRNCYKLTKQALIQKHYLWLNEYKRKQGCSRCGITDPRVLDFHHKMGEDKLFTISSVRRDVGSYRLKKEIEKCAVVCANCHRILHDEIRTNEGKRGA